MRPKRRFASLIALVIFGGLIWLTIYAYQDGFTKKWRRLIVKELAKHDLNIRFEKLTIDPFQGLVANDVVLLDHDTKQEVARISKARLDLDLTKLVGKKRFLQRIELESAHLTLPYDREDPASPRVELKDIQATVVLPKGRIEIARADADFHGLRVHLTGTLLRPDDDGAEPLIHWRSDKIQAARPILEGLARGLRRVRPEDHPPVLNLSVSGDLAQPETLNLKARLEGADFLFDDFRCRKLLGEASVTKEAIKLSNLTLIDSQGRLDITGLFPLRGSKPATFTLDSKLALGSLLPLLTPELSMWSWVKLSSRTELNFQGTLDLDEQFSWPSPPVDLVGHLEMGEFQLGEETFEHFSGDFRLQGPRFLARDVSLKHRHGETKGKMMSTPEEGVRYELTVGMDPTLVERLPLAEDARQFLERWRFRPTSGISIVLSGRRDRQDAATWEHKGHAVVTDCRYQTAEIEKLNMDFQLNPHAYHFSNVEVELAPDAAFGYSGGRVKAERISVSARDRLTVLTDVEGYVYPGQVVRCFSPRLADEMDRFRFSQPPEVKIPQGTIDPRVDQTNLEVEVKTSGTMTTNALGHPLPLDQPRFGLLLQKENLVVRTDHAGLFGGQLVGNVAIRNLSSTRDYSAKIELKAIDFGKMTAVLFPGTKPSDGQLTGHFSWRGRDGEMEAIEGKGVARLSNSQKAEIPVLGPLSALLEIVVEKTKISPGSMSHLGTQFSVQSSTLNLESIGAQFGTYQIGGVGSVHLPTEEVDIEVSLLSQSATGNVINALYGIFGSYRCTGTLAEPKWKLVQTFGRAEILKLVEKLKEPDDEMEIDPGEHWKLGPTGILKDLVPQDAEEKDEPPQGER